MGSLRPLLEEESSGGGGVRSDVHAGSRNAWALSLLQAGDHHEVDPLQRQRVWMLLSRGPARRAPPIGRKVMATSIVLGMAGGTAIASAALGHWPGWAVRAYERLAPWSEAPAPSSAGVRAAPQGRTHRKPRQSPSQLAVGELAPDPTPPDPNGIAPPALGAATSAPGSGGASLGGGSDTSRENNQRRESLIGVRTPRHLSQMPTSEDDRPVLAAMRALRRDKNPGRARTFLRKYLADHPNGTLAEEALALSIEAAVVQGDTDAKALAGRYLQIYPSGPFRPLAEQTLTSGR